MYVRDRYIEIDIDRHTHRERERDRERVKLASLLPKKRQTLVLLVCTYDVASCCVFRVVAATTHSRVPVEIDFIERERERTSVYMCVREKEREREQEKDE